MKESDYNTHQQFEQLLTRGRNQTVPEVNVRERVRAAIEQQYAGVSETDEISETLVRWFSGIRGGVFTGVIVITVFLAGILIMNQSSALINAANEEDGVTQFMDSGDWSELL
jgi:hypothetical protein